jgi:superfamily II DNA or RNA helicase
MPLYPYQAKFKPAISEQWRNGHKRVIMTAPTGAGKTVVFIDFAIATVQRGYHVLILTDRTELCKQTINRLSSHNIDVQVINAKTTTIRDCLLTVAMVESLANRELPFTPHLIIADECHKLNFTKNYDRYPNAYVIGATATPLALHLHKYFTALIQVIDTPELIAQGYLCPAISYEVKDDFSGIEKVAGEYTIHSQQKFFARKEVYTNMLRLWESKARTQKTIVFCVNKEHTESTCAEFVEAGYKAEWVTSDTPHTERAARLQRFSNGETQIMVNCGILTTGYDEPSIECVVANRKIGSLALFLQCCGRGSRTFADKRSFTIIDMGGNIREHGLWELPRTWEIPKPRQRPKQPPPCKICPQCDRLVLASTRKCPCGFVFPIKEAIQKEGVLVEVKAQPRKLVSRMTAAELFDAMKAKRIKPQLVWRIMRTRGIEAIIEFRVLAEYSSGWMYKQIREARDGKTGFKDMAV